MKYTQTDLKIRQGQAVLDFLKQEIPLNVIVAGGFMRWACSPRLDESPKAGDIDLFPNGHYDDLVKLLDASKKTYLFHDGATAITYGHADCDYFIQIIKPNDDIGIKTEGLQAVLDTFDFTVVSVGQELHHDDTLMAVSYYHHHEKFPHLHLRSGASLNPLGTLKRALKYAHKGYPADLRTFEQLVSSVRRVPEEKLGLLFDHAHNQRVPSESYQFWDDDSFSLASYGGGYGD